MCRDVGQVDVALRLFARAVPRLRRESRWLDLARVVANRGSIRAGAGELSAAIADYEEAERLYLRVGQEFAAVQTRHDLACAIANTGDLPRALRMFDDITTRFVELGHDASVPLLSRAEALLQAGLSADAMTCAVDAARRLGAEGNGFAAAQALVAVAEAARLEHDYRTAVDAAERARQWFAANRSVGWERAAELEGMRSRHESDGLDEAAIDRLDVISGGLFEAGDLRGSVLARCLAALAACRLGLVDRAAQQEALAAQLARRSHSLRTRLAVLEVEVEVRLARGDLAGARRSLRRALDALDTAHQLQGSGDAGTALLSQARSITGLADRLAGLETQPMRALAWMDRARTVGSSSHSAPMTNDGADATGFSRLRAIGAELRHAELAGEPTGELRHRHVELEQSMRRMDEVGAAPIDVRGTPRLGELKRLLGDAQLVSITAGRHARRGRRGSAAGSVGAPGDNSHTLDLVRRAATALRGVATSAAGQVEIRRRALAVARGTR